MSELFTLTSIPIINPYTDEESYQVDPATPAEIANAFWSLWWGANSKPTPDQIEAVQTACKTVTELTGDDDDQR